MSAGLFIMRRGVAMGARTAIRMPPPRVFIGVSATSTRNFSASAAVLATTSELSKENVTPGSEGLHIRMYSILHL